MAQASPLLTVCDGAAITSDQKLTSTSGDAVRFAWDVAMEDDAVAVTRGTGTSVEMFRRDGITWTFEQPLTPDGFHAKSVDIDGTRMVVGSPLYNLPNAGTGRAYVYEYNAGVGSWQLQSSIPAPAGGGTNDFFGWDVAISADTIVIGAPERIPSTVSPDKQGTVFVYITTDGGATWTLQQELEHDTDSTSAGYGRSVAILGGNVVVGAPFENGQPGGSGSGQIYYWQRTAFNPPPPAWSMPFATTFTNLANSALTEDIDSFDWFGYDVAIAGAGQTIIAGAPRYTGNSLGQSGGAFTFAASGGNWLFEQRLLSASPAANENFGISVSLAEAGERALVGAADPSTFSGQGVAYYFDRTGGGWFSSELLKASDCVQNVGFGFSTDLSGDGLSSVIGAPGLNTNRGAAYIFQPPGVDLKIEKDHSASPVGAGDDFLYTLTVTNKTEDQDATGVVVTDTLPAEVTWLSDTGPCDTGSLPELTCELGTILAGESKSLDIWVRVIPVLDGATVAFNSAGTYSDQLELQEEDNVTVLGTFLEVQNDLAIEKTDSKDPVFEGDEIYYTVTVHNFGLEEATGVAVTDTLPAGLTYLEDTGGCTDLGDELACPVPDLAPGQSYDFDVKMAVPLGFFDALGGAVDVTVVNTATLTSDLEETSLADNVATEGTVVERRADLSVTKTDQADPVFAGEEVIYTIEAHNSGPSPAPDVTVSDTLPTQLEYIWDTGGCTVSGNVLSDCVLGDLEAGQSKTMRIKTRVRPGAVATLAETGQVVGTLTITNTARVATVAGVDRFPANNETIEGTFVQEQADLRVYKVANVDGEVKAGEVFTYTIVVDNFGPSSARRVTFRDDILSSSLGGLSVVNVREDPSRNQTCSNAPSLEPPPGGITVQCMLDEPLEPVAGGTSGRWVVQVALRANEAQSIDNTVTVFSANLESGGGFLAGTPDPDLSNNEATEFVQVVDTVPLSVLKFASPNSVVAGETLTYQIGVFNNSVLGTVATNVVVEDILPAEVEVQSVTLMNIGTPVTGSCTAGTPGDPFDPTRCVIDELVDSAEVVIVVRVPSDLPIDPAYGQRLLFNDATVRADQLDMDLSDNLSTTSPSSTVSVTREADLGVAKSADPDPVVAGEELLFTLQVTNAGPSLAEQVIVEDALDDDLQLLSAEVLGAYGSCSLSGGLGELVCVLDALDAGGGATVLVRTQVDPERAPSAIDGPIENTVAVSSADPSSTDPNAGNNTAAILVDVVTSSDVSLRKTASTATPVAGASLVYTLEMENGGPSTAKDLLLSDDLGSDQTLLYVTDERCSLNGTTLECEIDALAPGESLAIDVHVRLAASRACGAPLANTASLRWDDDQDPLTGPEGREAEVTDGTELTVECASDLRITKFGKPDGQVQAGDRLTYTLFVDNLGPSEAPSAVLVDALRSDGAFRLVAVDADANGAYPGASCSPDAPPDVPAVNRLDLSCTPGERLRLLTDGGARWALEIVVEADEPQDINNSATITSAAPDPDASNNQAFVQHEITDLADLAVSKSCTAAVAGDETAQSTCTIVVSNAGPSAADNVLVYDRLPPGVRVTRAEVIAPALGSCTTGAPGAADDRLVCALTDAGGESLASGGAATVEIDLLVDEDVPDGAFLENDVLVLSDAYDDVQADNRAFDLIDVSAAADVYIEAFSAGPYPWIAGEERTLVFDVGNLGPSVAEDAGALLDLPEGLRFLRASVGTYLRPGTIPLPCSNTSDGIVECRFGALVPEGGSVQLGPTIFVDVLIDPALPDGTPVTTIGTIDARTADPVPVNNEDATTETVVARADLRVEKSILDPTPVAGEGTSYGLVVTNDGPSDAVGVELEDLLPAGFTLVNQSDTCSPVPGTGLITCRPAGTAPEFRLPAGASVAFQMDVEIDPAAAPSWLTDLLARNGASVSSATVDPDPSQNLDVADAFVRSEVDLRVRKLGKPDRVVRAGALLTYTIFTDNLGPSAAHGVVLQDEIVASGLFDIVSIDPDATATFGGAASCEIARPNLPADGLAAPQQDIDARATVTCRLGDAFTLLPPFDGEGTGRWEVEIVVSAPDGGSINDVASVTSADDLDRNPRNNESAVEHEVNDAADLAVTKIGGPKPVVAGETIQYTMTVTNNGPSRAENVLLIDRLPPGIVVTDAQAEGGSCTTGAPGEPLDRLTCGLGLMQDGEVREVTITATVDQDLPDGTILENDVEVSFDGLDPDTSNNFANDLTPVARSADLALDKSVSPTTGVAGETLEYTLSIQNLGPSDASDVTVVDTLPAGVAFASATVVTGSGSCVPEPVGQVTCQLGTLTAGASATITIVVRIDPSLACPVTLLNQAAVGSPDPDPVPANNRDSVRTPIDCQADLEIEKSSEPELVAAGEVKVYTISLRNNGPSDALDVVITDTLPAELSYLIDTDGCAPAAGNQVVCPQGTLAAGDALSYQIYARVAPATPADTILTNLVEVGSSTDDPLLENNSDTSRNRVIAVSDLKVSKFGKRDGQVRAGEILTYTVIVDNLGPSWTGGVALKDVLQSSGVFDLVDVASDRDASCVGLPGPQPAAALAAEPWPVTDPPPPFGVLPPAGVAGIDQRLELDCTLDDPLEVLAADGPPNSGRWILTLRVRAAQEQDVNNIATVLSPAQDPDPSNNEAIVEHEITDVADLAVSKVGGPKPVVAGEPVFYTMTVRNDGPSDAENVRLIDRLPPGIVLQAYSAEGGDCTTGTPGDPNDKLACGLGTIPAGESRVVTLTADVDPDVPDGTTLENDVLVTSDVFDPNSANDYATDLTDVAGVADLSLSKTDLPSPVVAGTILQYTLDVANAGPSEARDVVVVDDLPTGVSFVRADVILGNGACLPQPAGQVTCQLGDLAVGAQVSIVIDVLVDPALRCPTSLTNTAEVRSDTTDPNAANDTDTTVTQVACEADLEVTKTSRPVEVVAGEVKIYTIRVRNLGPSDAEEVVVIDTLPAELSYRIDTDGCAPTAGNTVTCPQGTLPAGDEIEFDIHAYVDPSTPFGTIITNTVTVDSVIDDPDPANNTDTSKNFVLNTSDLKISKFGKRDGQVRAGEILTYTVIVDNLGPSWTAGVAIKDVLQSSGVFDLVDVASDRDASCVGLPGPQPAVALAAEPWPVTDPPPPFGVLSPAGVATIDQRLELDCTLDDPLEVLAADGPPNSGRWILTMRVRAAQEQDVNNVARTLSPAFDPNPENNQAQVEHEITDVADLAVSKVGGPKPVVAGEPIFYTMTVRNDGPSDAENVLLIDRLPPGIVVTGFAAEGGDCSTGTPGNPADRLTCGLGTIPDGESRVVTVTADVLPDVRDGAILENDVFVVSDVFDPNSANNHASDLTGVVGRADLSLIKTDLPSPVVAGTVLQYALDIRNDGPSEARDVVVVDTLPPGVEFLQADVVVGSGSCLPQPAGQVTCQLGDLPVGAAVSIVIDVLVDPDLQCPTSLFNTATVSSDTDDPAPANNTDSTTTPVACEADLEVSKTSRPVEVVAGEVKIYTIRVRNLGPSDAEEVVVVDTLPAELSYRIDTDGCAPTAGNTVTCPQGTLPVGAEIEFDIHAYVDPSTPFGTIITNTVTVDSVIDDPEPANNTDTSKNFVLNTSDLKISKFGKRDGQVRAGDILTYTVIVDNLGPSWTAGVSIKELLQSSGVFDLVDVASDRDASCVGLPGPQPAVALAAEPWPVTDPPPPFGVLAPAGVAGIDQRLELDCTLDDPLEVLEADGPPNSGRWILTLRVRAAQEQDVNNVARTLSPAFDPNPENNQAYVEHEITDLADLAVSKTSLGEVTTAGCPPGTDLVADEVTAGRSLVYTVEVENLGPSDAENVILIDRLPPGIVVTGYAAEGGSCSTGTPGSPLDRLTCGLGTLASGETRSVTIEASVDPDLADGAILENDVRVTSDVFDPSTANDFDSNLTTVRRAADLFVAKNAAPEPVVAGELLEYEITVGNAGPSRAADVVVVDTLPAEVEFLRADGASCRLDPIDTRRVTCQLGDLPAGEIRELQIVTRVQPDAVPPGDASVVVTNEVEVLSELTFDPCLDNNRSTRDTTIERQADVYVRKSALPDPVLAGTELSYEVRFGNDGPSTSTDTEVLDVLPRGLTWLRCEPIDPNDAVSCSVVSGDGDVQPQTLRLDEILSANTPVFRSPDGTGLSDLDPGEELGFRLVARVSPGYVLDGRGDTTEDPLPQACRAYLLATGWPHYAGNRAIVSSLTDDALAGDNYDDVCTRVEADADLFVDITDTGPDAVPVAPPFALAPASSAASREGAADADGPVGSRTGLWTGDATSGTDVSVLPTAALQDFLTCDPVGRGGMIFYDITVGNDGPSDAAQVYLVVQLPEMGVVLDPERVMVEVDRGAVVEVRDDGRITLLIGNDPNNLGEAQVGRLNAGAEPVKVLITAMVSLTAECGAVLEAVARVETRRNDMIWPLLADARFPRTPTADGNPANNVDREGTTVRCPSVEIQKTVSLDGTCPGTSSTPVARPGQVVTYCLKLTNTGDTYLDTIRITDTLRSRIGERIVFTDTITSGADPKEPVAPGEMVTRTFQIQIQPDECGSIDDFVEVSALPVNSGRTRLACLPPVTDSDEARVRVPCGGADLRLQLPVLDLDECETTLAIQNVGMAETQAMVVLWGEAGACPPQAAGPLKIECTGLLKPGSAWTFPPDRLPTGARSAIVYSLSTAYVEDERGNRRRFSDLVCSRLFDLMVGSHDEWVTFDEAFRSRRVYYGPFDPSGNQLELDFGANLGEPIAVLVDRTCPDPVDPATSVSAAYVGVSTDFEGVEDPVYGGYTTYAPLVFADKGGLNSWIWIHNSGDICSSLEIWFKAQDNCLRPIIGDVISLAPGESVHFDPNTVVGPDWLGSAWIRASQPLGVVVDTMGPNHFTSYRGVPADVFDAGFTLGSQVSFAPLVYSEYQGWDSALQVQNLSGVTAAKVKVYFLDRSGDIITTLVDWICPRGSQTFFLPVIASIPGNWVGSARAESQEWWSPGSPLVDPPRIQSIVLLDKWADPARTARLEAVAYNGLTEQTAYDWQLGGHGGGTASGSAIIAVPLIAKGNQGITSELAITNLVPKPGFTDFAIYLFDQNGLVESVCQKLNEKQVEYIDLATWGIVPQRFLGSAVISAVFWEHDVFDAGGGFERNVVGLGAVAVERIGSTQDAGDVPGDESKAFGGVPIFEPLPLRAPSCPGVPSAE